MHSTGFCSVVPEPDNDAIGHFQVSSAHGNKDAVSTKQHITNPMSTGYGNILAVPVHAIKYCPWSPLYAQPRVWTIHMSNLFYSCPRSSGSRQYHPQWGNDAIDTSGGFRAQPRTSVLMKHG